MKKNKTYKILAAFLAGCFFLSACENDQKIINKLSAKKLGIEEAKNIKVNYTTGGKAKAILTSTLMLPGAIP